MVNKRGGRGRRNQEEMVNTDININVGSSGILNTESRDKRLQYSYLLSELDKGIINQMARVFESSKTKTQAFMRLEDLGINLEYLIALGLTTEEQIHTYQTIRNRGVLEEVSRHINESGTAVDEDYALEIQQLSRGIPQLKDIEGRILDEQPTLSQINSDQVDEILRLKSDINKLRQDLYEVTERLKISSSQIQGNEDDAYESKILGAVKSENLLSVDRSKLQTDEERQADTEASEWHTALEGLKNMVTLDTETIDDKDTVVYNMDDPTTYVRKVYVLSTKINLPTIEGYEITLIEKPVDLHYFTTSKSNLLVVTSRIPPYIADMFIKWIKGVVASNTGYRIVTLKGSEVNHPLIEDKIELTKDSLDNYYETHELESYTGDGIGSFLDISHMLD